MDYKDKLEKYLIDLNELLKKFHSGTDGLFLPTEYEAMLNQIVFEIKDIFDELFGASGFYPKNLIHILNTQIGGWPSGPTYNCVQNIIALVTAAKTKVESDPNSLKNNNQEKNKKLYVDSERIDHLERISNAKFDLTKLIKLLTELNYAYNNDSLYSVALLLRVIIDHVPPIFGKEKFSEVANNYNGGKSFKDLMLRLNDSSRKISDLHIHSQIKERELLPNFSQINYIAELDVLIVKIIEILN